MEHLQLWQAYARGSAEARDALLETHLNLVFHVARKLSRILSATVEFDELVSYGTMGLISAIDAFDVTRGLAFSTFAVPRIRGAILDELRRQDHVPRSVRRKARQIAAARETLSRSFNREPQHDELAQHLGIDVETLWKWKTAGESAVQITLDQSIGEHDGTLVNGFEALTTANDRTIEDELTHEQEVAILTSAIRELSEQERHVLALYYHEELKMQEIASLLGVTESRVSQIRSKALTKLRAKLSPMRLELVRSA
jgi:RNA polymerase sigma factor FliA